MKKPEIHAAPIALSRGFDLIASEYLPEHIIVIRSGGLLFILNTDTGDARSMEDMTDLAKGFLKFKER